MTTRDRLIAGSVLGEVCAYKFRRRGLSHHLEEEFKVGFGGENIGKKIMGITEFLS